MKFTMTRPAVLLALGLGLGVWSVQAHPGQSDQGLRELAMDARSAADVAFVCFGDTDKAACEDDMRCDCFCDVEAQVTCNGGAACPDIGDCLTNCACNICG